MPKTNLKLANDFASEYDESILENDWNGPQVIFDAVKTLLLPKSNILDLGIGTGESSKLFQKDGHSIIGVDGSVRMLEECKKKNVASRLILHNIEEFPYPMEDNVFDAVISNGLFHLVYPLKPVFSEVKRMLTKDGLFVFSYENTDDISESTEIDHGIWERKTESGVLTYKYADNLVTNWLANTNFEQISQKQFLTFTNKQLNKDIYFNVVVAEKI